MEPLYFCSVAGGKKKLRKKRRKSKIKKCVKYENLGWLLQSGLAFTCSMENQDIMCINKERDVAISQKKSSMKQFKADRTIFLDQNDGGTAKAFPHSVLCDISCVNWAELTLLWFH